MTEPNTGYDKQFKNVKKHKDINGIMTTFLHYKAPLDHAKLTTTKLGCCSIGSHVVNVTRNNQPKEQTKYNFLF